jgi:23S rRNA pseudouridine1911/1915/1917 synthase
MNEHENEHGDDSGEAGSEAQGGAKASVTLTIAQAGRADLAVGAAYPAVGRKRLAELFAQGAVRKGKRVVRKGDRLAAGEVVELAIEPAGRGDERPTPDPDAAARLTILLERPELVAVSKPAPMASQPLRAGELGSAASGVAARYPECRELGDDPRDGGAAHRLDIGTTGVLLFARTAAAYRQLRDAFSSGAVVKTYLAVTTARPVGTSCSASLAQRGKKVVLDEQEGLEAHTDVTVLSSVATASGALCLVRCTAQTGRMHQVRAHLAALRAPIAGDALYGAPPTPELDAVLPAGRFLLHAESVALPWGSGKQSERLVVRAPLPEELKQALLAAGLKVG